MVGRFRARAAARSSIERIRIGGDRRRVAACAADLPLLFLSLGGA